MALAPRALILLLIPVLALASCGEGGEESTSSSTTVQPQRVGGEQSIERLGEEASGSEREAVLSTFSSYLGALGERDYQSACPQLAKVVRESLAQIANQRASCAEVLPAILAPSATPLARAQAEGQVTKVRIEEKQGFVVFKAPGAKLYQLTMVREGGEWKAGSATAAVLVPAL